MAMSSQLDCRIVEEMLKKLELTVTESRLHLLLGYAEILLEGLKKQRLTGEKTINGIIGKQIYDCLYPLKLITIPCGSKVLDLGTGGGLPGIPVKICMPNINLTLLDSNQRKSVFLESVVRELGLENVICMTGRAEEIGRQTIHREQYDYVISRAVAEMVVLAELALPLIKLGGRALLYKGSRGICEAERAAKSIALCGGEIEQVWSYTLETGEQRSLFMLAKNENTPAQYPRKAGRPSRKPLL